VDQLPSFRVDVTCYYRDEQDYITISDGVEFRSQGIVCRPDKGDFAIGLMKNCANQLLRSLKSCPWLEDEEMHPVHQGREVFRLGDTSIVTGTAELRNVSFHHSQRSISMSLITIESTN